MDGLSSITEVEELFYFFDGNPLLRDYCGISNLVRTFEPNINSGTSNNLYNPTLEQIRDENTCALSECPSGDIVINSQSQLDLFLEVCDTIKGNLIIRNSDVIDLSPLSNVVHVEGRLEIVGNSNLTNIIGLESLVAVDGSVAIENNPQLFAIQGLSSLGQIGGSLRISNNSNLLSLQGLEALNNVGEEGLFISSNVALETLNGLQNIRTIEGRIEITDNLNLIDYCDLSEVLASENVTTNLTTNGNAYNPIRADILDATRCRGMEEEVGIARIQFIHNAPSKGVQILANGEELRPILFYRTATPYLDIPAGTDVELVIIPRGSSADSEDVLRQTIRLRANQTYLAGLYGTFDTNDDFPVSLSITEQAMETASTPSNLILQFFHGATDATTFNLSENETTLFEAVGYGNFGAERAEVLASNYILNLSSETSDQNYRANISFWRGKSATIFLFGSANDFRPWIRLSNGGTFPLSLVNNVGQDVDYQISTKVKYLQASLYPNPVQTNIYLDLDVAKSGKVRVEVVEVNGKIVQVLADEMLEKGSFQFTTSLKAGVYFCRIQQEEEVLVRQFVVL